MKKRLLLSIQYGLEGIGIGFLISLGFSFLSGSTYAPSTPRFVDQFASQNMAILVSALLWAGIGIAGYWLSVIFSIHQWSLLKQTIIHALLLYSVILMVALISAWFPLNWFWLMIFTLIFIAYYGLIFWGGMRRTRREIAQINHALKK